MRVHDPTYTAYADVDYVETQGDEPERSPAFGAIVATVAIMVPALLFTSRRRRT